MCSRLEANFLTPCLPALLRSKSAGGKGVLGMGISRCTPKSGSTENTLRIDLAPLGASFANSLSPQKNFQPNLKGVSGWPEL